MGDSWYNCEVYLHTATDTDCGEHLLHHLFTHSCCCARIRLETYPTHLPSLCSRTASLRSQFSGRRNYTPVLPSPLYDGHLPYHGHPRHLGQTSSFSSLVHSTFAGTLHDKRDFIHRELLGVFKRQEDIWGGRPQ